MLQKHPVVQIHAAKIVKLERGSRIYSPFFGGNDDGH